jgi:hypothetical protein
MPPDGLSGIKAAPFAPKHCASIWANPGGLEDQLHCRGGESSYLEDRLGLNRAMIGQPRDHPGPKG